MKTKEKDEINKAEYTATPVACEWVGAVLRSLDHWTGAVRPKSEKPQKGKV